MARRDPRVPGVAGGALLSTTVLSRFHPPLALCRTFPAVTYVLCIPTPCSGLGGAVYSCDPTLCFALDWAVYTCDPVICGWCRVLPYLAMCWVGLYTCAAIPCYVLGGGYKSLLPYPAMSWMGLYTCATILSWGWVGLYTLMYWVVVYANITCRSCCHILLWGCVHLCFQYFAFIFGSLSWQAVVTLVTVFTPCITCLYSLAILTESSGF